MRLVSYAKLGLVLVALLMLCAASAAHADPGSVTGQPGAAAPGSVVAEAVSSANPPVDISGDTSVTTPGATSVPTPGAAGASQGTPAPPSSNQSTDPPTAPTSGPQTTNQPPPASTLPATPVDESSQSSATANQTLPSGPGSSADQQGTAASDPVPTAPLPSTDSGVPGSTPGEPSTTPQVPAESDPTTQVPAESNPPPQVPAESNTTAQVPAASNTTTQAIWQIQLSGCRIHCNGTSQTQLASQLNTTVQATGDLTPITANSTLQTGAGDGETAIDSGTLAGSGGTPQVTSAGLGGAPPTTSTISQTQLGCLRFCFGSTTVSTLEPQLSAADVDQLLGELEAFNPPALDPIPALDENVVDQTAVQYQDGQSGDGGLDPTGPQTQSATQINSTIQIFASSLLSNLGAAGGAASSAAEALNQTLQGIWQLQIGCVFDCFLTQQTQQAQQSNTTIYVQPDSPATATSAANTTMGLIWQLQVGCLFLCYDAVEVQTATSSSTTLVVVPVAPPPTVGSGGGSPGGPAQQAPPSTSPVGATGVTLATTISAPSAPSTISAPSNPPISAFVSPPPRPSTVALQPLGSVSGTELARTSRAAISVAPYELVSVGAGVAISSNTEQLSAIRLVREHLIHREARRLTRNHTSTPAIEARATASSVPLGIVFVLLLVAVVGLVGSEFRSSTRKQS